MTGGGFNEGFIKVATHHENTKFASGTEESVLVVHCANMMTRKIGYSLFNDSVIDLENTESSRLLGIRGETLNQITQDVTSLMKSSVGGF